MPVKNSLVLHNMLARSKANGPGVRAVIWAQGCTFHCPGCFNPETHEINSTEAKIASVDALVQWVIKLANDPVSPIEGITISGGEPLLQWEALLVFLQAIKKHTDLSVLIFTGYTKAELCKMPFFGELVALSDVIIAGRYQEKRRIANALIGSANKSVLFNSERYNQADLDNVPQAEVIIRNGQIYLSGINPVSISV